MTSHQRRAQRNRRVLYIIILVGFISALMLLAYPAEAAGEDVRTLTLSGVACYSLTTSCDDGVPIVGATVGLYAVVGNEADASADGAIVAFVGPQTATSEDGSFELTVTGPGHAMIFATLYTDGAATVYTWPTHISGAVEADFIRPMPLAHRIMLPEIHR